MKSLNVALSFALLLNTVAPAMAQTPKSKAPPRLPPNALRTPLISIEAMAAPL